MVNGGVYTLMVSQDSTGSRTLSYATNVRWPGGTAPTLSTAASKTDVLSFISDGLVMYGLDSSLGFSGPWTQQSMPSGSGWMSVTYGNGKFVATGLSGWAMTSADGVTWTSRTGSGDLSGGVAYGNGVFVAIGQNNVATSSDGITWTAGSLSVVPEGPRSIAFGNGVFVVGSYNSSSVQYSSDGVTWNTATLPLSMTAITVVYGGGLFIMPRVGSTDLVTSPDGVTWTHITLPSTDPCRVAYGNGTYVIINFSGYPMISTNGSTWHQPTFLGGGNNFADICFGGEEFVLVPSGSTADYVYTSSDAITWTKSSLPLGDTWRAACYGNGKFVILATSGNVATSP